MLEFQFHNELMFISKLDVANNGYMMNRVKEFIMAFEK